MALKINIMGATGQLGRRVVENLIERGSSPSDLIASVRTVKKAAVLAQQGVQVRHADYDDLETMKAAFKDTDVLVLIPSTAAVEPRMVQHHKSLQAAKAAGVGRVIFVSLTTAAFLDSKFEVTPYLMYAEMKLRQSDIPWTILRNTMYLDPIVDWLPELIEMNRLPYPIKDGRIAFASRDDLARAIAAACTNPDMEGKIFELTGPEVLSMPALAQILSDVTGEKIVFDSITDQEYAEVCRTGSEEIPEMLIRILTSIYWATDNGEFGTATDHIEQLTGTVPQGAKAFIAEQWANR